MPVLDTIDRIRVTTIIGDDDAIALACLPVPDAFNIETDCVSPYGHAMIVSCGDIVCRRCSKVLWL